MPAVPARVRASAAVRIAVARAPAAAATVAPAAIAPAAVASAAAPVAVPARAAVAAAPAASADRGELLDGLAGHGRVGGEAQADAAALAVDLDHAHLDLLTAVEHVLDGLDALAGRDVRDVQEAVGALGELDEGAERGRLHDLAGELVADLDLLRHGADPVGERVALLARGGVDADVALVVDVDLRLVLVGEPADGLPALADEQADLVRVDLDGRDPGGVLRELLVRRGDHLGHLAEDVRAGLEGLLQRVTEDVEGDARDLDVHLEGGDALGGAGDLEVHVAEVVLHARDVREDDVVVALLDQAHRDARHGALDRHARVHEGQRGAADGRHRGRPVGLEDVRHDTDRVRELVGRRDHRHQGPLGKRAVADVAALRPAHEPGLPDGEGREVVVVPVELLGLEPEAVEPHLLARGAEGGDGERLGLAAREERGPVGARRHADLDRDRADLLRLPAVGADLPHRDAVADDLLLELVEHGLGVGLVLRVGVRGGIARVLLEDRRLDGLRRVLALELVVDRGRLVELLPVRVLDLLEQVLAHLGRRDLELVLARLLAQVVLERAQLLDRRVRDVERVEDLRLGDLARAGLDHEDGLVRAGHDQVELGALEGLLRRVDDEVALDLPDPDRAHGLRERDVGDHQRRRHAVHGEDVVRMLVVDRDGQPDELRLTAPALGEERPQRAVDHPRDEGGLLAGATLAAEEGAGDLAGGVHALLDVHRQREEVDVALVARRGGAEHVGVARTDDDGAGGLFGHLAGLEGDLGPADLRGDALHGVRHMWCSLLARAFGRPGQRLYVS